MARLQFAYIAAAAATVTIHVVAFGGLSVMKKPEPEKRTVAVMVSAPKKKEKAKPPEPPKPIEAPKEMLQRPTAPRHAAAPPPVAPPDPVAAAHPQMAALPDFGISMTGGLPGAGGIAIPMGGGARPADLQPTRKEKVLGVAAERPSVTSGDCPDDMVKAKPQGFVKPTYTDDARAAGIEGRVRVEITIDETGKVVSTKIVSGLGHGLDESAIDAAKRMNFNAATKCGTAVKSTFVLSMRFVLGE
jgi:periplasmic protein TonB